MAAAATDKFIKVGNPGSATNLAGAGYTIGDSSITVDTTTNWPTDTGVVFVIDVIETDENGEEVRVDGSLNIFQGVVTTGTTIGSLTKLHGDDQNYDAGATTRVYITVSSQITEKLVDGLVVEHNQDGTHSDITADDITVTDLTVNGDFTLAGTAADGWTATGGTHSVATGYNAGNRSFTIDTSTDISGIVSEGMRYRVQRGTTPPTQCADLESGSSHYASKSSPSGITFTDDFTCEAWIKLESYANGAIVSRYNGSTGWWMEINTDGTLEVLGTNGTTRAFNTYQSIPLNKWVHVAVTLDMSGAATTMYVDGVLVPSQSVGSTGTALTQAGNFQVGARNGANFFDGKLADVRVWSDIRTATEIQDNMFGYPSDTTGLVAHFKLNGDFTDSSSNGNNLTASGGAVATNADNPWNATEYGIITAVSASDITVFCPVGYGIPNETLTAPFYSTQDTPFGFPRGEGKWTITLNSTQTASTNSTSFSSRNEQILLGTGYWQWNCKIPMRCLNSNTASGYGILTLSSDGSTETDPATTVVLSHRANSTTQEVSGSTLVITSFQELSTPTTFTSLSRVSDAGIDFRATADQTPIIYEAVCAYI